MQASASWRVIGTVVEKRELTSEKNKDWRGWVCKVATFGLTAELQLTRDMFGKVGEGESLDFAGRFELSGHNYRLVTESVQAVKS